MSSIQRPAPNPCGSCPYRCDVPSGVWEADEYHKLPAYDNDTASQPLGIFMCHQQDGRVCAGWAACHDMDQTLAIRFGAHRIEPRELEAIIDYETTVEIFASGAEAAAHGLANVANPDHDAQKVIDNLTRKRDRRRRH